MKPISWLFQNDFCDVYGLRFINKNDEDLEWKALFAAVNMGFFPVMYFFSFLYYTDLVSMLFVLLTYRLYLAEKFYMSAAM
ncbi:hypothetical protein J437_LFUL019759, partial [Ladona fulva]